MTAEVRTPRPTRGSPSCAPSSRKPFPLAGLRAPPAAPSGGPARFRPGGRVWRGRAPRRMIWWSLCRTTGSSKKTSYPRPSSKGAGWTPSCATRFRPATRCLIGWGHHVRSTTRTAHATGWFTANRCERSLSTRIPARQRPRCCPGTSHRSEAGSRRQRRLVTPWWSGRARVLWCRGARRCVSHAGERRRDHGRDGFTDDREQVFVPRPSRAQPGPARGEARRPGPTLVEATFGSMTAASVSAENARPCCVGVSTASPSASARTPMSADNSLTSTGVEATHSPFRQWLKTTFRCSGCRVTRSVAPLPRSVGDAQASRSHTAIMNRADRRVERPRAEGAT